MKRSELVQIFLRSLTIQASLNYRRMQNLGFAFALMPLARREGLGSEERSALLSRHLQVFNTHPYLSPSIVGSVTRVEEEGNRAGVGAGQVKTTLMGPYAALGDAFFGGSVRPCVAIVSVALALAGWVWAPLLFLALFTPAHLWIRIRGFIQGYRLGTEGYRYVQGLNLPTATQRIRWFSLILTGIFGAWWTISVTSLQKEGAAVLYEGPAVLVLILLCLWAIRRGISRLLILYGAAAVFFLVSVCYAAQ
jgi:PTS system mannose-specific IID component